MEIGVVVCCAVCGLPFAPLYKDAVTCVHERHERLFHPGPVRVSAQVALARLGQIPKAPREKRGPRDKVPGAFYPDRLGCGREYRGFATPGAILAFRGGWRSLLREQ